jgi:CheY-like chemotaxis protein
MDNEQHGRTPAAQQVRVLIVDPHASSRSACKALLQTEGLAVVAELERCEGAEDVAAALCPDVVLIDVSSEQTEGLALARRLSAHAQRPAVVLMSATRADAIVASSAGADLFLPKAGHHRRCDRASDTGTTLMTRRERVGLPRERRNRSLAPLEPGNGRRQRPARRQQAGRELRPAGRFRTGSTGPSPVRPRSNLPTQDARTTARLKGDLPE